MCPLQFYCFRACHRPINDKYTNVLEACQLSIAVHSFCLSDPNVTISPPEIAIAGESFSLTCTVTLAKGDSLIGDPAVQWIVPDGVSINSDTQQVMTNDSTVTYISTLEFIPVQTSHGGQYTCQATSTTGTSMDAKLLTVQCKQ